MGRKIQGLRTPPPRPAEKLAGEGRRIGRRAKGLGRKPWRRMMRTAGKVAGEGRRAKMLICVLLEGGVFSYPDFLQ